MTDTTPMPSRPKIDDWCNCPMHTLFPQRISELVEPTLLDLEAACALIGKDSYGKPVWTPETISPHNLVVQAFARHALTAWNTRANADARLVEALTDASASLAAAISLLERGGKPAKKAAPSDRMFDQMVKDYKASLTRARAALSEVSHG